MAPNQQHPPGPAMTLGNMHEQGVHHLIAYCHDACRHQAIIDVSGHPPETPIPWFRSRVKCGKCGRRGHWIDVKTNWKEREGMPDN